jgi:exonuclease SbcC
MRSNWCKKDDSTCVKVWINDGKSDHADREILKGENVYHLHAQTFKAFGTSVPQELQDYFNFSEVNLQSQLDAPFLLSDTPGQVASFFNTVAGLSKIDTSTANINSAIRQLTSDINYKEEQELTLTENLGDFDHLEKMEIEIEALEVAENQLQQLKKRREKLMDWCIDYQETDTAIDVESELLQYEKPLNEIFELKGKWEVIKQDRKTLWGLISSINLANSDIEHEKGLSTLEEPLNNILALITEKDTKVNQSKSLSKLISHYTVISNRFDMYNKNLTDLQVKLDAVKICPFCGNKIK